MTSKLARLVSASVAAAVSSFELSAAPVISEFLASNASGQVDGNGNATDWIEIWNESDSPINLDGWSLSDDPANLGRWPFPPHTLQPGERYVVHASGQATINYVDAKGAAHTNFKVSSGSGGFLALVDSSSQIVHAFRDYPGQRTDVSFGLNRTGEPAFFPSPTPGAANGEDGVAGLVADTKFSIDRGLFTEPISVMISTGTEGATIRYTTDGSIPTSENGQDYPGGDGIRIENDHHSPSGRVSKRLPIFEHRHTHLHFSRRCR